MLFPLNWAENTAVMWNGAQQESSRKNCRNSALCYITFHVIYNEYVHSWDICWQFFDICWQTCYVVAGGQRGIFAVGIFDRTRRKVRGLCQRHHQRRLWRHPATSKENRVDGSKNKDSPLAIYTEGNWALHLNKLYFMGYLLGWFLRHKHKHRKHPWRRHPK